MTETVKRTSALAGVIAAVLWTSPVAVADPGTDTVSGPAVPATQTLTLAEMGSSSTISFYIPRYNTQTSMTFPVPAGLVPQELRARVELPVNLRYGVVTVIQNDRIISRVGLPLEGDADLVIPLQGAELSGGWVNLKMTLTAVPAEDYCWDDYAPVRLTNGAVVFSGAEEAPRTVADFLPPVLRKVTIAVPAQPSQAESNAAVQVAAALAQRNGQFPDVSVVPLPEGKTALDALAGPFERQVVVKEAPTKSLSLQGGGVPSLLISGSGNELAEQARLLTSDSLRFATSATSVPDQLPEQFMLSDSTTIGDMNDAGLKSEALWPSVGILIDQTRFGHPLGGVQVHLIGSYTPLPANFGGEVTASVGGVLLDRWPTTGDGTIDRLVTIPDTLVRRSMTMDVALRTTGDPGHCGDHLPITLRMDRSTAIQADTASPPVPQGFQAFPQAQMPRIQIGVASEALADTVRAALLAVNLQRSSGVPLTTELTSVKQALDSGGSAVLIAPDGLSDAAITLPFSVEKGKVTVQGVDTRGDSVAMTLGPDTKFGSLQTVFDGRRSLLIASSNGAPDRLDDLLRWITVQNRWAGLRGRALIGVPGGEPITVPDPPVADSNQADGPAAVAHQDWFWWAVGGIAAIAASGALLILLRARRAKGS